MNTVRLALVGNPNCGKSTLCNLLTGSKMRVGNWPGVTVERKSGHFDHKNWHVELVDLPGVYSLTTLSESGSLDTRISCEAILSGEFDCVLNVVDASNLERNLYLTAQLLSLQIPVLVLVNMQDVAHKRGIDIDLKKLAIELGCPVMGVVATDSKRAHHLQGELVRHLSGIKPPSVKLPFAQALQAAATEIGIEIQRLFPDCGGRAEFLALQLLEGDEIVKGMIPAQIQPLVIQQKLSVEHQTAEDADILLVGARYEFAHRVCQQVVRLTPTTVKTSITQRIDRIVLNRVLGIPIFLAVIYALFFFSINIGGVFQPLFDGVSSALFVDGLSQLLQYWHMPVWLIALLGAGVGTSINTVVTFTPVIGAMFLFLSLLESSGYMARATFVIDRLMRALGMPGKAFIPLIIGFGCNVPAILATRTLEHRRDRLLTLMMTPFMSCGARMAIYSVFVAAFFPHNGQNIVFLLYVIGIVMAMLTGIVLRKTLLEGDISPWIVELPPYHRPKMRVILRLTWQRLRQFLIRAGKLIIPVCLLVSVLNAVTINGKLHMNGADSDSILSWLGKKSTPLFAPMGIQSDNWPATVGLLTGVLAKEVVVGTLNTLYTQIGGLTESQDAQSFDLMNSLTAAIHSVYSQAIALKDSFSNPITASAADSFVNDGVYGIMFRYFDGIAGAMAYLLFVLLYFPCVSATAAMIRESNVKWGLFSVAWTTGLAYGVAVVFYQGATWVRHPVYSALWISGVIAVFGLIFIGLRRFSDFSPKSPKSVKADYFDPGADLLQISKLPNSLKNHDDIL